VGSAAGYFLFSREIQSVYKISLASHRSKIFLG